MTGSSACEGSWSRMNGRSWSEAAGQRIFERGSPLRCGTRCCPLGPPCSRISGGYYIALFDFATNVLPAFLSCNVTPLHQFGLKSEVRIFDHFSEPACYIAILEMKKPGLIIDAI